MNGLAPANKGTVKYLLKGNVPIEYVYTVGEHVCSTLYVARLGMYTYHVFINEASQWGH